MPKNMGLLMLMIGLLISLGPVVAADQLGELGHKQQKRLEMFLALTNDEDWLTGMWHDVSPGCLEGYVFIERSGENYAATYYFPRYTIAWCTEKIEKGLDHIRIWNYEIDSGKLASPSHPSEVFYLINETLYPAGKSRDQNMQLIVDKGELAKLAKRRFSTGREYLQKQIDTRKLLREVTEHYDLIRETSAVLAPRPPITDLEMVRVESHGKDKFLLAKIVLAHLPRSGPGGCTDYSGYYWAHLGRFSDIRWTIKDEWILTAWSYNSDSIQLKSSEEAGYEFYHINRDEEKLETWTMSAPGISQRPVLLKANRRPSEERP